MKTEAGTTDNTFLETALSAVRSAGRIVRENIDTVFRVDHKGATDLVTEVDLAAEKEIIAQLSRAFPEHRIAAEESGRKKGESDYVWWIDPIDGTTNFVHGYPCYSISVALECQSEIILGIVYDPTRDELFQAVRGEGAQLNGCPITVSSVETLSESLLATGFPYDRALRGRALSLAARLLPRVQGIRRDGSAARDLAYVAAGRLDGFWEFGLKPWDTAAGRLLVEEAGGSVSDFKGEAFDIHQGAVVATNRRIHAELVALLN
ncbi:MAG: inositol monophosphatase family protein [Candidatus Euphemobacter frigidus]|nr:inositol monophosphatase family protein [Candidatus Euphemobacter frigidus]MDP8276352.1 inositol monophosphatase family protein [Candidatus Euphemobacter frigidus]